MKKLLTTPKSLYDGFAKAVGQLKDGDNGVHYWKLANTNGNIWAIVLGRTDDDYIAVKVAFQPNNSIMQCDYSVDWLLPYDKESGEVEDCEWVLYDTDEPSKVLDDVLKNWNENKTRYLEMTA